MTISIYLCDLAKNRYPAFLPFFEDIQIGVSDLRLDTWTSSDLE